MSRELEPWSGEVRLPRSLRWLLRRRDPEDTPERRAEARRRPAGPERSVLEAIDKGGGRRVHVQDPPPSRRRLD